MRYGFMVRGYYGEVVKEGNGVNWLELLARRCAGIERTVVTEKDVEYRLTLDAAGGTGYTSQMAMLGIYIDDERIGGFSIKNDSSDDRRKSWESLSVGFTGGGGAQTIRLVTENTDASYMGRGVYVDNIALEGGGESGSWSVVARAQVLTPLCEWENVESGEVATSLFFDGAVTYSGRHAYRG